MRITDNLRLFFTGLVEKIFRRKELRESKLDASFLRDRVKLLTSGDSVALDQHERRLILQALEFKPFAMEIHTPATRFYIRGVWRRIREKIKLSIKKEDQVAKEVNGEIIPIPEKPDPGMIDHQYKTDKTEAKK